MEKIKWSVYPFHTLSSRQVYDILKLRQEVFIIEQDCIYDDIDGYDPEAQHLCGYMEQVLVAYARIFGPGLKFKEASIGRIVVNPEKRSHGLGKELVTRANEYCRQNYEDTAIRIEAQSHLQKFYNELGYRSVGNIYPVDGIDHIQMIRS